MPAVSSGHDREHQTDNLLVSSCTLLCAIKVSHRYKHVDITVYGHRQCEVVNGNISLATHDLKTNDEVSPAVTQQ